jgi:hypothetical protein
MRTAIQASLEAGVARGTISGPQQHLPLVIDYLIDCLFDPSSQALLVWAGGSGGLLVQCRIGPDFQVLPTIIDSKPPFKEAPSMAAAPVVQVVLSFRRVINQVITGQCSCSSLCVRCRRWWSDLWHIWGPLRAGGLSGPHGRHSGRCFVRFFSGTLHGYGGTGFTFGALGHSRETSSTSDAHPSARCWDIWEAEALA